MIGSKRLLHAAPTPVFDRAKVSSNVEKMICGNLKLAKADADLSSVYHRVTQHMTGDQLNSVKTAERGFIKQRNLCQTEDCVAGAATKSAWLNCNR